MPRISADDFGDAARVEARRLMHELENEPAHAEQVTRLALALHDGLARRGGAGAADRAILEAAALLHDVGWSESEEGRGHHKIAARIILERPWQGLPPEAVLMVACVARYHRKALPRPGHKLYGSLSAPERRRVEVLAGILRVADGLDRTHLQRVREVAVEAGERGVRLWLEGAGDLRAEIAGALRKADLFEDAFGGRLEIAQR